MHGPAAVEHHLRPARHNSQAVERLRGAVDGIRNLRPLSNKPRLNWPCSVCQGKSTHLSTLMSHAPMQHMQYALQHPDIQPGHLSCQLTSCGRMLLPNLCSLQLLASTALPAGLKLNHRASGMRVGVFSCHTTHTCSAPSSGLLLPAGLLPEPLLSLPLLLGNRLSGCACADGGVLSAEEDAGQLQCSSTANITSASNFVRTQVQCFGFCLWVLSVVHKQLEPDCLSATAAQALNNPRVVGLLSPDDRPQCLRCPHLPDQLLRQGVPQSQLLQAGSR